MKKILILLLMSFLSCKGTSQNKLLYFDSVSNKKNEVIVSDPDLISDGNKRVLPNLKLTKIYSKKEGVKIYYKDNLFFSGKKMNLGKDSLYFTELYDNKLLLFSIYNSKEQNFIQPFQTKRNQCYIIDYVNSPKYMYSFKLDNQIIAVSKEWLEGANQKEIFIIKQVNLKELYITLINKKGEVKKYKLKKVDNRVM